MPAGPLLTMSRSALMKRDRITIEGAHQNNLKNLDLEIPLGELVVVTGVSGSGKSSLASARIYQAKHTPSKSAGR